MGIGFKTYWLPYQNVERVAGETKWNFWKLLKYAFDGIINFSEVPLSIASWSGIGMAFVASIMLVVIIVRRLCFGDPVAGWASTMCVIVFIGAIQLFCIGQRAGSCMGLSCRLTLLISSPIKYIRKRSVSVRVV